MTVLLLQHLVIGFLMAFIGLMAPGLLTLSALKVSVERGEKEGVKFAWGVMIPIFVQAHIALFFAHYLVTHSIILVRLSQAAILLFVFLAYLFFRQGRKGIRSEVNKFNIKNSFFYGMFISLINPMAIPFYLTYSSILEYYGYLVFKEPYITVFVFGAIWGAFAILALYSRYARRLIGKVAFLSRNFYYVLSFIFVFLALASLIGNIVKHHADKF